MFGFAGPICPIEVLQAINARMKTERERDAKEFRATGQQQAQQIRAAAEKEQTIIIAEAEKKAQITRGEGDKTAITIWNNAANVDPQFYAFIVRWRLIKKLWLRKTLLWCSRPMPSSLSSSENP